MSNTAFQASQIESIRKDRASRLAKFEATGAFAEIGIISNIPGTYTVNTLNGPRKANFENAEFNSPIEAVKAYASEKFGNGTMKKTAAGTFLVFTA